MTMSASDPVGTGALLWTTRRLMNDCREKQTYFSAEIKTLESSLKGVRAAGGLAGTIIPLTKLDRKNAGGQTSIKSHRMIH